MKQSEYVTLVKNKHQRYVRINCVFPGQPEKCRLFGMITYFNYFGEKSRPACDIGVSFGQMEEKEINAFRTYYDKVRAEQGAS